MKKYIIYAPQYNDYAGGVVAMHKLCHLLNEAGEEAYIWKWPNITEFKLNQNLNTPTIYTDNLEDYIVVYMESVAGNPLNAPNVVRWLLHHPGFFTNSVKYGKNEVFFYFQDSYYDEKYIKDKNDKLFVENYPLHIYKRTNFGKRSGSCYMMKKGKGRKLVHNDPDSVCIDGLTHQEIAKIFNEKKYFYCYDIYTAYTNFAAFCGCIPVVIPKDGLSKEEWIKEEYLYYGVAYGFDDIDYAVKTLDKASIKFEIIKENTKKQLEHFINKTQKYFSKNKKSLKDLEDEKLDFIKELKESKNKIVCFGASESFRYQMGMFEFNGIKVDCLCDNDPKKWGKEFLGLKIYSPNELFNNEKNSYDVIITSIFVEEIKKQLQTYPEVKNIYSIY